jgi:uncharacterized protein YbjT (DUF2867 family)
VLVVGATGQLGTAVVRRLLERGHAVRALARSRSDYRHLVAPGIRLEFGDLRDPLAVRAACDGVGTVVATATAVFPRGPYSFPADEGEGYGNLLDACGATGVRHVVFISNAAPPYRRVPSLHFKRLIERRLAASGVAHTILRAAPFMDDYFALMGSTLPLRGAEAASLRRPFWLSSASVALTGNAIERYGVATVTGPATRRHQFIALGDVAALLVAAVERGPANRAIEVGGPEALSWAEVAALYGRLLQRRVRVVCLPAWTAAVGALALRGLSPAAANQLALLWVVGSFDTVIAAHAPARELGVPLRSAEEFLVAKLAADQPAGRRAAKPAPPEESPSLVRSTA